MIIPINGTDKVLGVHMHKVHNVGSVSGVGRANRADAVSISSFSSILEQARAKAMSLPDIRTDVVEKARLSLQEGNRPQGTDIASSMINRAAGGMV